MKNIGNELIRNPYPKVEFICNYKDLQFWKYEHDEISGIDIMWDFVDKDIYRDSYDDNVIKDRQHEIQYLIKEGFFDNMGMSFNDKKFGKIQSFSLFRAKITEK